MDHFKSKNQKNTKNVVNYILVVLAKLVGFTPIIILNMNSKPYAVVNLSPLRRLYYKPILRYGYFLKKKAITFLGFWQF